MKKTTYLLILIIIAFACSKHPENFSKNTWVLNYITYDSIYKITNHKRDFIRNDSAISYSDILKKEIAFPIHHNDSIIIYKSQITLYKDGKVDKDTIYTDSLFYDFKYICNTPVLLLKHKKSDYVTLLTCKDASVVIKETRNIYDSLSYFKVSGIKIGDTISNQMLINIKDCDSWEGEGLIEANLKSNENIKIKLINKNIVYEIKQEMIEENAIGNIVSVINSKIKCKLDSLKPTRPFYTEGFKWFDFQNDIEISKSNLTKYYLDEAEKQKDEYRRYFYLKMANDNISKNKYWTLEVKNTLIKTVLDYNYKKYKKVSAIIE
ncbi:MAG: hypothetical protein WCL51_16210 [Bacteroidota bacterium]